MTNLINIFQVVLRRTSVMGLQAGTTSPSFIRDVHLVQRNHDR